MPKITKVELPPEKPIWAVRCKCGNGPNGDFTRLHPYHWRCEECGRGLMQGLGDTMPNRKDG